MRSGWLRRVVARGVPLPLGRSLSARHRARLYRKLGGLVAAGLPMPRALDAVHRVTVQAGGGRAVRRALEVWRLRVYDGQSVGAAVAGWVPRQEALILEAGASDLPRAFADAAGLVETTRKMTLAVTGALVYPTFLAMLLAALLWIFSARAIPAFADIRPVAQWTGAAAALGEIADLVRLWLIPGMLVLVVAVFAALASMTRWTGTWRARLDRLPPWSLYKLVSGTSFVIALAAFLRAGIPLPEALRRLETVASAWLRERIAATLYYVISGHDLGEALARTGFDFPSRVMIDELRVHAALGGVDVSLRRLSETWVAESLEAIALFADAAKLLGMMTMAGAIAWVQIGIIAIQRQLSGG